MRPERQLAWLLLPGIYSVLCFYNVDIQAAYVDQQLP